MSRAKTNTFLQNMKRDAEAGAAADVATESRPVRTAPARKTASSPKADPRGRDGKKHFGGYLDPDMFEKVALLRIRLNLGNDALLEQAINDLFNKEKAKRAFGG
ncbi:hypothetical protein CBA19CS22_39525 [Caballeronia novacaledonica]|uniref:Uncharacterized protein n=1 Tax=Caballeronia novacaledonica TaxID=1544861 RepID=A0ACB5R5Y5_9BURK|nr:hypothetical protein CBA19CS22_39525 [Caballeronia novacaledonica]